MAMARIHTQDSILATLDSDLTDEERKSFVNELLQSPNTAMLLHDTLYAWEMQMLEEKASILLINEKIKIVKSSIKLWEKYNSEEASSKIKKLNADHLKYSDELEKKKEDYAVRIKHARSMDKYSYPMLNALKKFNQDDENKDSASSVARFSTGLFGRRTKTHKSRTMREDAMSRASMAEQVEKESLLSEDRPKAGK